MSFLPIFAGAGQFYLFMLYLSVAEFAKLRSLPERIVRHYCSQGKIAGAFLTGKTWSIPADAVVLS